jgi:hypothetical protein
VTADHLGERAGAFADGVLDPETMARAWAHYRACALCRDMVEGQRAVRGQLRRLKGAGHIPPDVLNALFAIGSKTATASQATLVSDKATVSTTLTAITLPEAAVLPGRPTARQIHRSKTGPIRPPVRRVTKRRHLARRHPGFFTAGLAALLTTGFLTSLWVVGGSAEDGRELITQVRAQALAIGKTSQIEPVSEVTEQVGQSQAVLEWMRQVGWSAPHSLPPGFTIRSAEQGTWNGHQYVSMAVDSPTGLIVMTGRRSDLDTANLGGLTPRQIGGRTVYVDESDGRLACVWQVGNDMVAVVSDATTASLAELIAVTPLAHAGSFSSRIARGWESVRTLVGGS